VNHNGTLNRRRLFYKKQLKQQGPTSVFFALSQPVCSQIKARVGKKAECTQVYMSIFCPLATPIWLHTGWLNAKKWWGV
jgi:hypothetical protein